MELLGGASLSAIGLTLFGPALKTWLELKKYRRG
jgi:hypothetical protein